MDTQRYRILIVDDLVDNLFLLQTLLESEGYLVDTASSGGAALTKLRSSLPDLVLLDVMMPDMSGYEVTRWIRQNQALNSIPILLVSAYEEASAAQRLALGANGFIRKPFDADELLDQVQTTIASVYQTNAESVEQNAFTPRYQTGR